jgi:tetratricopeptide (TPR) repeat protein
MNRPARSALTAALFAFALTAAANDGAKLGKVHFKVECNQAAQTEFNVAMAYYHSFAWSQMQGPLERVLKADPSCGMAHWARALASLNNPFTWPTIISAATLAEGPRILQEAERAGLKSKRERDYVAALGAFFADQDKMDHKARAKALEAGLEQLMRRYPRDEEAATLYALVLSANFDPADKKYTNQLKAAKILEPIFLNQPDHPGAAHYLIHSYDYPPIAKKGLEAARRYGKIAPDAPHALHMPSHIFTRVGAWRESIESNRASARAAGDKSFDKWHAHDYIVYAHLQLGEHQAARQVVEEALNNPARIDHVGTAYAYAAMPARLALERAAWGEAAGLELFAADSFPWKKYTFAEAVNAFARGVGAAKSGDATRARVEVERLEKLREATKVPYWAEQVAIQAEVVKGLALLAEGDSKQAITTLREAAKREDATEKHAVTPGPIVPAREVLAYVLLDKGEAKSALREFEAVLAKEPNRLRALSGAAQAAERSNNRKKAKEYGSKLPT